MRTLLGQGVCRLKIEQSSVLRLCNYAPPRTRLIYIYSLGDPLSQSGENNFDPTIPTIFL